jgi:hypothetical protein
MKIYSVKRNANNIQWIIPRVPEDNRLLELLTFDCAIKEGQFDNIDWYIFNTKGKKGIFFNGITGALVFDQLVYESDLFTLFETAGEILPIKLEGGEKLYALNILECINMLNSKETTYDIYDNGENGRIINYSFYPNRISESSIFKIPETSRVDIFTYTGVHDESDEFFYLYKKLGLTGLVFEELYST